MIDKNTPNDTELDALLADMATAGPDLDTALLNRVMADAEQVSAARIAPAPRPRPAGGFWTEILGAIGGWGAVAGLSTATLTGVWLGFAPPDQVPDVSEYFLNSATTQVLDGFSPNYDSLLGEG